MRYGCPRVTSRPLAFLSPTLGRLGTGPKSWFPFARPSLSPGNEEGGCPLPWGDLTRFPQPGKLLTFWRSEEGPQRQAGGTLGQASPELGSPTGNCSGNLPCFSFHYEECHLKSN